VKTRGLPEHARPLAHIEDPRDIMGLAVPKLHRPIVLVHGLAQHADTWVNLKNFLTNDPDNKYGGVYAKATEDQFLADLKDNPDAKVFALDLSDNLASPADVAGELRRAIGLICGFTGARQVDVVTHSMGALVARSALRDGESRVDHLVMVSPPNQGSYEANLGTSPLYHRYPKDDAMASMRVEHGPFGGVANEWLHGLNEAWESDKHRVDATIITGVGLPTPDRAWRLGTAPGDGMVTAHRAWLGDTPFFVAEPNALPAGSPFYRDFQEFRYNHLQIASEPEVFKKIGEIVTADPPPPPPPEPIQPHFWDVDPAFLREPEPTPQEQYNLFKG
jgi:pimeloyl-ACP methyl ester carboxylesterase